MDAITALSQVGSLLNATRSMFPGISRHTGTAAAAARPVEPTAQTFSMRLIQALDRDGNGALSVAELQGASALFAGMDADSNGQVTAMELAHFLGRQGG